LCVPASTLSHVGSKNNERWLRTIDHISKLPNVFNVYFCRNIEALAPNVIRLCIGEY